MTAHQLTETLKAEAQRLGFRRVGVCPAVEPAGLGRFHRWLEAGFAGEMRFFADRKAAYSHPRHVLDGVRSIMMLALPYTVGQPRPTAAGQARISRYAWGAADYHDVIDEHLKRLVAVLLAHVPAASARGVCDTAPLLEHEFAQLAGLGWVGKNTLLLDREFGSWMFLAALLTDVELAYDEPFTANHCGTCTACLDACPTGAFPEPYVLDARRCLSYLTIELRESIPTELRPALGDRLFGCDICQDVCPWNRRVPAGEEPAFAPLAENNPVDLSALFSLSEEQFRGRFRPTPLWRAKRRGVLRNAAILFGNRPTPDTLDALTHGLNDAEPLVRAASAWALGRCRDAGARKVLSARCALETNEEVRHEIAVALGVTERNPADDRRDDEA